MVAQERGADLAVDNLVWLVDRAAAFGNYTYSA